MHNRLACLLVFLLLFSGCTHVASESAVPVVLYEKVAEAFVMVARADEAENGTVR